MGAAYLLAMSAVATVAVVIIREMWHTYRQADREWRQAQADERFARQHRIDQ